MNLEEMERRLIAVTNEIAHVEDQRYLSTREQQKLDALRETKARLSAAIDAEMDQIGLFDGGAA